MKKKYVSPNMEIIRIKEAMMIADSPGGSGDGCYCDDECSSLTS